MAPSGWHIALCLALLACSCNASALRVRGLKQAEDVPIVAAVPIEAATASIEPEAGPSVEAATVAVAAADPRPGGIARGREYSCGDRDRSVKSRFNPCMPPAAVRTYRCSLLKLFMT
jgi:hypothetical protein